MKTFLHSGDRGDSIYSLPVIRDNGPGILCVADKPWTNPITPWIESARKLIEAQPYISALKIHQGEAINHDFSTFRKIGHHQGRTIAELHATWTRLPCDINKPWLTVEPNPDTAGKIVVNRTPRYNNEFFPWKRLVDTFSEDMVFIGLPQEHQAFCDQYGKVPYLPTNDLYEVAAAIAASEVYMANQSVGYAICEGLKHRSIQETHLQWADCIYARDNATYCFDGFLSFEACGKHFENPAVERRQKVVTSITPPGGWLGEYAGCRAKSYAFDALIVMLTHQLKTKGIAVPENLREILVEQARDRMPETQHAPFRRLKDLVRKKYQAAGLESPY